MNRHDLIKSLARLTGTAPSEWTDTEEHTCACGACNEPYTARCDIGGGELRVSAWPTGRRAGWHATWTRRGDEVTAASDDPLEAVRDLRQICERGVEALAAVELCE